MPCFSQQADGVMQVAVRAVCAQGRRALGLRCLTSDGYLHKTEIPTDRFQKSLPRLPVSSLGDILSRFLASAAPLVSPEELKATKALADDFEQGLGKSLHAELKNLRKTKFKNSSFISEWWYDMYLKNRSPLPINVNPQMTFLNDPNPAKNEQATRAASMLHASASFFRTLRDGHLEPDVFHTKPHQSKTPRFRQVVNMVPEGFAWHVGLAVGAYALDMSQYGRLFQSTRIPQPNADVLQSYPDSRHIVVQRGHDFYTFDLLDAQGNAVPREQIEANLRSILAEPLNTAGPSLGALTTMDRDAWASARAGLVQNPTNAASLEQVDSALFALCLEDQSPTTLHERSLCMLYGTGTNRWFDKSFQLIVAGNGCTAVNFEHAWGDGVAVLRYFNEVYQESITHDPLPAATLPAAASVTKLAWDLDAASTDVARRAVDDFTAAREAVELQILETRCVDSPFLKSHKIGVDGTLQMSFQLAHYRMYGHSASTYESASTAGFKHGRTETIRSATELSDKFCKAMCDPATPFDQLLPALKAAVEKHAAITKEALMGKGWDRQMFALEKLAEAQGATHPLFSCTAATTLKEIILSTSTLSSPALDGGGFGPVGERCYGIGYGIRDEGARMSVMSYHRDTAIFVENLQNALYDMRCVLEGKDFRTPEVQAEFWEQEWGRIASE